MDQKEFTTLADLDKLVPEAPPVLQDPSQPAVQTDSVPPVTPDVYSTPRLWSRMEKKVFGKSSALETTGLLVVAIAVLYFAGKIRLPLLTSRLGPDLSASISNSVLITVAFLLLKNFAM